MEEKKATRDCKVGIRPLNEARACYVFAYQQTTEPNVRVAFISSSLWQTNIINLKTLDSH